MAKLYIRWVNDKGVELDEIIEQELTNHSAAILFSALLGVVRPLSDALRQIDDTGQSSPIELTPAQVECIESTIFLILCQF